MNIDMNSEKSYECNTCNYKTIRKNDWEKHLKTKKHIKFQKINNVQMKCLCDKIYVEEKSYERHIKTCNIYNNQTQPKNKISKKAKNEKLTSELIIQLIKQNEELREMMANQHNLLESNCNMLNEQTSLLIEQKNSITTHQQQMIELSKQPKTIKNNFNVNFFLNVQCKDALNISEFVNNLAIKISDIEKVGKLGYVEGISRIILEALQQLDLYKRPIHCTDIKKEVLFVKDEDKWDKDENKLKIKKAISHVAQKNCRKLCDYIKPDMMMAEHPDCEKNLIMMKNVNGGDNYTREKNHDKIISIISKEISVEKQSSP